MNIIEKLIFDDKFDTSNNLNRWNGTRVIKAETVAEHSYNVALFARVISEELLRDSKNYSLKLRIVSYALFHDFDETFTGDVSHDLKYDDEEGGSIRSIINKVIKKESENFLDKTKKSEALILDSMNHYDSNLIKNLIKICDWLAMCFYLKKEIEMGNKKLIDKQEYCILSLQLSINVFKKLAECGVIGAFDFSVLDQIIKLDWAHNE